MYNSIWFRVQFGKKRSMSEFFKGKDKGRVQFEVFENTLHVFLFWHCMYFDKIALHLANQSRVFMASARCVVVDQLNFIMLQRNSCKLPELCEYKIWEGLILILKILLSKVIYDYG